MEGGGWRVEGGGWRVEGGGWRVYQFFPAMGGSVDASVARRIVTDASPYLCRVGVEVQEWGFHGFCSFRV